MSLSQRGYHCNVCHVVWMFWLRFGQIFVPFLGTFIADFEYYLFIVNATLLHIFVKNLKGIIFMGVVAKH